MGVYTPDPGHVEGALPGGIKTVFLTEFGHLNPGFLVRFHVANLRKKYQVLKQA